MISVLSNGIKHVSSKYVGMYMCTICHDNDGWLFIFIICKYGEMFAGVGILVTFPRNAYLLCMSVSRPPLPWV